MNFELLGAIMQVETFALGDAFERWPACGSSMAKDVGENRRDWQRFDSQTAPFIVPKFTGMKQQG